MADTKISALTAASAALGADELAINEAGTSKKLTVTQLQAFNAAAIGAGFFGDGSDGAITLQQSTGAPAWASKAGTVFTLTRDVYATTCDMDDSAGNYTVKMASFRIFAATSLIIDAGVTVHNDGNAGVADAAGAYVAAGTIGRSVGAGSVGAHGTASQAAAIDNSAATAATVATAHGGTGGLATGGGTGGGVAGGTSFCYLVSGSPRNLVQAIMLRIVGAATAFSGGGGGTGGNATGGTTSKGGGGGSGAGVLAVYAKILTNNGIIRAQGGAGGNGVAGDGTGSGGGGGGGGGAIILVYGAGSTTGTLTVTGGAGGTPTGTGATGGTGVSGLTYTLVLS
jgi:hypothetical protein